MRMDDTETIAFTLRLVPGGEAEYRRRHDALWPDMREALLAAGILHYEIYLEPGTHLLFGHIVRRKSHAMASMPDLPVMARWRAHMADLLIGDASGPTRVELRRMFRLVSPEGAQLKP
jgi:L-rhamnose mutarotase